MFDKVRILLEQYARVSDGKFSFRIYNPEVFSNREDQALADGMQPLPIIDLNQNAFFGIRFTDELDNHAVIPFFALERINFLEQDLTSKIYTLNHRKKTVGILTPLSVFDTVQDNNIVTQKWQFVSQIEEFYNVVNVQTTDDIDGLDALIIVYPRHLTDAVVEKIKNYSNQGGKILLFADVAPEAARIYSPNNNDLLPSDLSCLDSFWGFRFNTQKVVADLTNSLTVDATNNYRTNPTFTQDVLQFILKQRNFNKQAPEMMQLNEILFASASVIEPLEKANVAFTPLISASLNSQLMPALAAQRSVSPERLLQNFQPDVEDKVLAAKIVSLDEKRPYQVIAVADTDMLYDSFWATSQVVLDKTYVVPLLDNVNFVLNSLESLIGEDVNLIGLRGKNARRRSFENVEKMRRDNERNYKVKEAEIDETINGVIFDDTTEDDSTVYGDISGNRISDESVPKSSSSIPVHLAGEESDNFTTPNESTIPEYNASGYLAGEGGLNYSQDEFISEGHDGLACIIPEDIEHTLEKYPDGIYPSVIEEIKAEHDDIWAEKPEHPALVNLRRFLPYILAFLSACAFIALAVLAVKLSSGNLISKKEREKLREAEEKAAEELQNAPVIQAKTSIVVGSEPSDDSFYNEKVKISEEVETTKGSLIKRGAIKFSELVRMDAVPWNGEETLTALVRQVSLNA